MRATTSRTRFCWSRLQWARCITGSSMGWERTRSKMAADGGTLVGKQLPSCSAICALIVCASLGCCRGLYRREGQLNDDKFEGLGRIYRADGKAQVLPHAI